MKKFKNKYKEKVNSIEENNIMEITNLKIKVNDKLLKEYIGKRE